MKGHYVDSDTSKKTSTLDSALPKAGAQFIEQKRKYTRPSCVRTVRFTSPNKCKSPRYRSPTVWSEPFAQMKA